VLEVSPCLLGCVAFPFTFTLTLIDEYSISVEFVAVLELLTMELNGIMSSAFLFHYMIVSVHLVWAHER
jgi:hypothetical protein